MPSFVHHRVGSCKILMKAFLLEDILYQVTIIENHSAAGGTHADGTVSCSLTRQLLSNYTMPWPQVISVYIADSMVPFH